jgi:capsular exopolysaccharide synthesis family protein
MFPNSEIREATINDYIKILKKRLWIIVVAVLVIPVAVLVFDLMQVPLYKATTSLVIDIVPSKVKTVDTLNVYDRGLITDQITIIKSGILAEEVFNTLRLNQDPDFKNLKSPVAKLTTMIKVDLEKTGSKVVLISVSDTDALRASLIANTLAEAYLKRDVDSRNKSLKEAGQWLQNQLDDIRDKEQEASKKVNVYAQENKIVTSSDAGARQDQVLMTLKQQRLDIEQKIVEASRRYKEKHPTMINLRADLANVNSKIEEETKNASVLKDKLVQYNLLVKEAESYRQLYNAMLQRSREVGVSEKIEGSGIRILDKALPAEKPFKPTTQQDVLRSILIAFLLGCGIVLFIEYLDSSMRTAEDVSSYLDLPFLGYIPPCDKQVKTDAEKSLVCFQMKTLPIAESFRALRTSILFSFPEDKPLRTMMVTSALPDEGKSFTAINLALIFCQLNEKVLLVDVDMRNPRVNKVFSFDQKPGMSTILTGNCDFDQAVRKTFVPGLSVITSGLVPPNPSELLHSSKLIAFIEEAKTKFDRVIFDCPPVLVGADSLLVANKVNGVVFVIKGALTRLPVLVMAKKKLIAAKASIVGAIINNLKPEAQDHYYYHYSYKEDDGKKKS